MSHTLESYVTEFPTQGLCPNMSQVWTVPQMLVVSDPPFVGDDWPEWFFFQRRSSKMKLRLVSRPNTSDSKAAGFE